MAKPFRLLVLTTIIGMISPAAYAADTGQIVDALKQGGHVVVFRHVETDESQKDVYPFRFDDMGAQRQLSDKGRETARQIGGQLTALKIPVGEIYTSKLNRAVETGKLIAGKDVTPIADLTDSGAGNPSAMARPGGGGNAQLGQALRRLANAPPKPGMNTILVTHKTNIADGFGKDWNDVKEGEASVFKPSGADGPTLVGRIQAADFIRLKGN